MTKRKHQLIKVNVRRGKEECGEADMRTVLYPGAVLYPGGAPSTEADWET